MVGTPSPCLSESRRFSSRTSRSHTQSGPSQTGKNEIDGEIPRKLGPWPSERTSEITGARFSYSNLQIDSKIVWETQTYKLRQDNEILLTIPEGIDRPPRYP